MAIRAGFFGWLIDILLGLVDESTSLCVLLRENTMTTPTNVLTTITPEVATQIHFEFASNSDKTYEIYVYPTTDATAILWFGAFDPTGALATDKTPSVSIDKASGPVQSVQFQYNARLGASLQFTPAGSSGLVANVMMYLLSSDQSITSGNNQVTVAWGDANDAKCTVYLSNDNGNAVKLDNVKSQTLNWTATKS